MQSLLRFQCFVAKLRFGTLVLFIGFLCGSNAQAQQGDQTWYFGKMVGVSFVSGQIQPNYDGQVDREEGSACISDSETGDLLFYTDGSTIWNAQHLSMAGPQLSGHTSSTQSALIVPSPGHENQYHVFSMPEKGNGFFGYVRVDMSLDNGLGGILDGQFQKVNAGLTEKLTAVPHSNGTDYWVIVHEWNSTRFISYLLDQNGLSDTVYSDVGANHFFSGGNEANQDAIGYLKPSPNGKRLACAIYNADIDREAELFDFDAATGIISNPLVVVTGKSLYGVSFSPDNSKLYIAGTFFGLFQFDLGANGTTASDQDILNSMYAADSVYLPQSIQNGPDGRTYIARGGVNQLLSVINAPNEAGALMDFDNDGYNIQSSGSIPWVLRQVSFGLPNMIESVFDGLSPTQDPLGIAALNASGKLSYTLYPNPANDHIMIRFDDASSGTLKLEVLNVAGSLSIRQEIEPSEAGRAQRLNLESLAPGMYMLRLQDAQGHTVVQPFSKQ